MSHSETKVPQDDTDTALQETHSKKANDSESDQCFTQSSESFVTQNKTSSQKTPKKSSTKTPKKKASSKFPEQGAVSENESTPKKCKATPSKKHKSKGSAKKRSGEDASGSEPKVKSAKLQADKEGSDEDGWQDIGAVDDDDINEALEQKAMKVKMTAKNVRSVIHHLLKNEHVLNVFKDVLDSDKEETASDNPSPVKSPFKVDCVPKMTRAKVKDFLEKICMPSPVKTAKDGPSILDLEFTEEEDDDEYNPDKDEECRESDEESFTTSSQASDFGSPYPPTPTTPLVTAAGDGNASSSNTSLQSSSTVTAPSSVKNLETVFNACAGPSNQECVEGEDTIAYRTRSKLPLTSTSINEIESAFVAPDITADMYDTHCDDADWVQFLSSLYKTGDDTITDDDTDANDPEFNYIAEAELETPDAEDFRFDKPTKITKKELSSLINELHDLFDEDEVLPYQVVASVPEAITQPLSQLGGHNVLTASTSSFVGFKTPLTPPKHSLLKSTASQKNQSTTPVQQQQQSSTTDVLNNSVVTPEQRSLIEDNMRKHIQLLAQSFLLFGDLPEQQNVSDPKSLIMELDVLRQASAAGTDSVFNVCNLSPALDLLSDPELKERTDSETEKPHVLSWKNLKSGKDSTCALSMTQRLAVYNSPTFVYPHLLPKLKKVRDNEKKYNKFLASEDNLLALGLEQFQLCRNVSPVQLIHKLLIRGKNADQIHFRIQFLSSAKSEDNVVKCVKKTGKLPENFPKPSVDRYYPKAPKYQMQDLLPSWCWSLKESRLQAASRKKFAVSEVSSPSTVGQTIPVTCSQTTASPNPAPTLLSTASASPSSQGITNKKTAQRKHFKKVQVTKQPIAAAPISSQAIPILPQVPAIQGMDAGSPALILQKNMPPISGIYIQFATPYSASVPVPQTVQAITNALPAPAPIPLLTTTLPQGASHSTVQTITNTLPVLAPKPSLATSLPPQPCQSTSLVKSSQSSQGSKKRKALSPLKSRKNKVCVLSAGTETDKTNLSEDMENSCMSSAGTQTEESASPDLLAKTMMSCGIEESPVAQPSQSPLPQDPELHQNENSSTAKVTEAPKDKHPTVRNLSSAFEAAHQLPSRGCASHMQSHSSSTPKTVSHTTASTVTADSVSDGVSEEDTVDASESCLDQDISLQQASSGGPDVGINQSERIDLNSSTELAIVEQTETEVPTSPDSDVPEVEGGLNVSDEEADLRNTELNSGLQTVSTPQNIKLKENSSQPESDVAQTNTESVRSFSKAQTAIVTIEEILARNERQLEMLERESGFQKAKPRSVKDILEAAQGSAKEKMETAPRKERSSSDKVRQIQEAEITGHSSPISEKQASKQSSHLVSEQGDGSSKPHQDVCSPQGGDNSLPSPISATTVVALHSPAKSYDTSSGEDTSFKTPTKLRPLFPKAVSPSNSSSPSYVPLPKISPKRKELNKQVRQILPKSFVFEVKSPSPTKAAALVLKKKATLVCQHRSPVKILPKQPQAQTSSQRPSRARPLFPPSRVSTRSQRAKAKISEQTSNDEDKDLDKDASQEDKEKDAGESEASEVEDACLSQEEEDDDEDLTEDEDRCQLDDLMAACTTIRYDPKKGSSVDGDTKSKAQKKRDLCLSMLEPEVVERDPKKDERDTAYAQHYFNHVKHVLQDDSARFKKFLTILRDLNKDHTNPVELYADMACLLSDHQDLVDDFAGFLLSFQAVECQCFVSHLEYQQIRRFLRQLEIYCDTSTSTFQRTLKMMTRWSILSQEAEADATPFKERIGAVLRHVPGLMDDLLSYFFDGPLPDSHPEDFEDVDLEEDDMTIVDGFEEITLPEGKEDYNTKLCKCDCHLDQQDEKLRRRIRHCFSCSLKMYDGKPILNISRNKYHPVSIVYPHEEKEKLAKARKEAAQLALAKAKAQKQKQKKKKKGKGSKKTFKKQKSSKASGGTSSAENTITTEARCLPQESRGDDEDRGGDEDYASHANSDLTKTEYSWESNRVCSDSNRESVNYAVSEGKSNPLSIIIKAQDISQSGQPDSKHLNSSYPDSACAEDMKHETKHIITVSDTSIEESTHCPCPAKVVISDTQVEIKTEPLSNFESDMTPQSSMTPTLGLSSSASITQPPTHTDHLSDSMLGDDIPVEVEVYSVSRPESEPAIAPSKNKPALSTPSQTFTSLSQLLSAPLQTKPISSLAPRIPGSLHPVTFPSPRVLPSHPSHQTPAPVNTNGTDKPRVSFTTSSQVTALTTSSLQPQFPTTIHVTATRIPVMFSLSPQQFLPPETNVPKCDTNRAVARKAQSGAPSRSGTASQASSTGKGSASKIKSQKVVTDKDKDEAVGESKADGVKGLANNKDLNDGGQNITDQIQASASGSAPLNSSSMTDTVDEASFITALTTLVKQSETSVSSQPEESNIAGAVTSQTHTGTPGSPTSAANRSEGIIDFSTSSMQMLRAQLDNISMGGYEESLGLHHLQHLAQNFSPSKFLGDSVSKFDLLAFIEASNLTCKDATRKSIMTASALDNTNPPLLSFSGALSQITSTGGQTLSAVTPSDSTVSPSLIVPDQQSAASSIKVEPQTEPYGENIPAQNIEPTSSITEDDTSTAARTVAIKSVVKPSEAPVEDVLMWTEEWDRSILNVITEEGVTQAAVEKIQSNIPDKSHEEITSRARQLLDMLQDITDSESDVGTEASQDSGCF